MIQVFPFSKEKYKHTKKRPEGRSFMRSEGFTYPSGSFPAENQERSPSLQLRRTLSGYENHSVVLDSLGILPFLWLEVALYSEECSLDQAVE